MQSIVCQVNIQGDQVELIWSRGGAFFDPYVIEGTGLADLRRACAGISTAKQSKMISARLALDHLMSVRNSAPKGGPWTREEFALAEVGYLIHESLFPGKSDVAAEVRAWVASLPFAEKLEFVVNQSAASTESELLIPWNLVYDRDPWDNKSLFDIGKDPSRWLPFWGVRYCLTSTRRVEPTRRDPVWRKPRLTVVVSSAVADRLKQEGHYAPLGTFLSEFKLESVGSLAKLREALDKEDSDPSDRLRPRLLYWLSHGSTDYLQLDDGRLSHTDFAKLLGWLQKKSAPGMLAFLNACESGDFGTQGSFLERLHDKGFIGAIATECRTIDTFATRLGVEFLRGFLKEGKPLGELLHELRSKEAPFGLVYGAHCPSEVQVQIGKKKPDRKPSAKEGELVPGLGLGGGYSTSTIAMAEASEELTLPEHPYRSLGYFDEEDRALYTGRDADVLRFAETLDRPDTRILILQGESGIGKSSFLRAGVIPYLERECAGYRFIRKEETRTDGRVIERPIIIASGRDLLAALTQTLLDLSARPLSYPTPDGRTLSIDLRPILEPTTDFESLRSALRKDAGLFATLLGRMAGRLPHALVLTIDQMEEIFTLMRPPRKGSDQSESEYQQSLQDRDQALIILQHVLDLRADVKLILSLRTEYYGRLLDHLRAGRRNLTGVRDELLRDFSHKALVKAITRPTSEQPVGSTTPRSFYGFRYAPKLAERIAKDVLDQRTENQDSVLPLAQVVCTQLLDHARRRRDWNGEITAADFNAMNGVNGGLLAFANDSLIWAMNLSPRDQEAFKSLFTQLCTQQPDGTLTTSMKRREDAEREWRGTEDFDLVLRRALNTRMLREDELRIQGAKPTGQIRLGHDALARVAATWRAEREAKVQQHLAQRRRQQAAFNQVDEIRTSDPERGKAMLLDPAVFPSSKDRDFAWGFSFAGCNWVRVIKGHEGVVFTVAYSPEGKTLATGGDDGTVRLWDAATGQPRGRPLEGHRGAVRSVAFSPEGKILATGGQDGTVRLWNAATGEPRGKPAKGHAGWVFTVAYSPDGKTLATGGQDGTVRLWNAAAGEPRGKPLEGHKGWVSSVAFSSDSRTIATGGKDSTVRLWDAATGEPRGKPLKGHKGWVNSLAYSPDGKTLATGGNDGTVRLWDAATGEPRGKPLKGHKGWVSSVAFSSNSRTIATGGGDGTVRLWDAATGEPRGNPLKGHADWVNSLAYNPVGKTLATGGGKDGTVRLWDAATGEQRGEPLEGHKGWVISVAYSPDGKTLATGGRDCTARLWDATTGQPRGKPLKGHEGWVNSVAYSSDGRTLATGGDDGTVRLWDVATGRLRGQPLKGHKGPINSVTYSPDSETLATGGNDGTVRLWDAATGQPRGKSFEGHEGWVNSVAYSPEGKTLATGGDDGTVRLWDAATGQPRGKPLEGHKGWVNSVAYNPDSKTLATGGNDGTVRLWDAATGEPRGKPLEGHTGPVFSVAFSTDGKTLATGGEDHTVRLWDTSTGEPRGMPLVGHTGPVFSVAFSTDGKTLANAGTNGVRLWRAEFPTEEPAKEAAPQ